VFAESVADHIQAAWIALVKEIILGDNPDYSGSWVDDDAVTISATHQAITPVWYNK